MNLPSGPVVLRRGVAAGVVTRGRIDNASVLARELDARGRPTPATDAELVAALLDAGPATVAGRLHGSWTFAYADARERVVAADGTGLLDVAWGVRDDVVYAGRPSEVAAALGARVDRDAVDVWLATGALPAPRTGWSGVHRLPAGYLLRVTDAARVEPWWTPPPSTPGGGSANDLVRWGKSLGGAFRVVVARSGADAAVVQGDELDEIVARTADERRREPMPRVAGEPADVAGALQALTREGPALSPSAVRRHAALVAASALLGASARVGVPGVGAPRVLLGDGGRAMAGDLALSRSERVVAGLLGRVAASRLAAVHARARAGDPVPDDVLGVGLPYGPSAWGDVLVRSRSAVPHALDRLWWLRGRLLRGLAVAGELAGVDVAAPWASPAIETLLAQVPIGLHAPPGRRLALVREALGDVAGPVEREPPSLDRDVVAEALEGWVPGDEVRSRWATGSAEARFRLSTVAAWRRGGSVG